MAESSEGEEEGKLIAGNQHLVVDDGLREMAKKAAWSVSSCKSGNGVLSLRYDDLDAYWQYGSQPHLVNIQFQKKIKLQEPYSTPTISVHFKGVHYLLHSEMRKSAPCVI
ncbi:hypothetical protein F0562_006391 [Nyssa sinensis]|uniref:DOC domain-containing protein n=1 Tax=Nyssa sinensis TaxID=561372 RepID=A0A5J5AQ59_9ASTE|nr:hypothetical protein F0562_006391 [Nyssa sinensis]